MKRTVGSWRSNLWNDLIGPRAYRTWIVILTSVVTVYFGAYAVIESRHDRQMNRAMFERNTFITMVSSGNRGTFVAAMKDFGPIQNMSVSRSPPLFPPWMWFETDTPNLEPLHRWAVHRIPLCDALECGIDNFRIDLRGSNFRNAYLFDVDLTGANLEAADLRYANLRATDLSDAHLDRAGLMGADLSGANLTRAFLSSTILDDTNLVGANLTLAYLYGAHLP